MTFWSTLNNKNLNKYTTFMKALVYLKFITILIYYKFVTLSNR